jgi:hypothetical protein
MKPPVACALCTRRARRRAAIEAAAFPFAVMLILALLFVALPVAAGAA